uniref:FERM domain-containing protein n=1 Tax=Amphilophus citrinellus TaxID=61819 RepID=A0A3Q0SQI7_AMPCI
MACFQGNREEFYREVLLLANRKLMLSVEQGIKRSSKVMSILRLVFAELGVVENEFFGLKFCDDRQQTVWLDPSKTLSQHRELAWPPYIFYFGVKFYVEDPSELKEETTRYISDVCRGHLLCPAHLRAQLSALMLQGEQNLLICVRSIHHQSISSLLIVSSVFQWIEAITVRMTHETLSRHKKFNSSTKLSGTEEVNAFI